MKSIVGKPTAAAKGKSQAKKPAAVAKPQKKTAAKPVAKPAAKSSAKASAKPPVKPVKKVLPKAKIVKSSKPAKSSKAAAPKAVVKKVVVKAAVKTKNQKPAPKVVIKKVNVVLKTPAKSASTLKAKEKTPAGKTVVTAPRGKASVAQAVAVPQKVIVKAAQVPVAVVPVAAVAAPVPAKAGRPSSRLAQLTVPSMAQSVASTAAKSSYTQMTVLPLIVPPLASATKKDPKLANNWKTKPVEQMSDAELLAMPDSEYMNEKQMAVFRLKLALLKQDILNSAGETTEHLREDTVVVPDPADRATIEEEHALELRTRDRERKLLKKIEQSINRIDAGDYGYCDETGEPIGVGRLLARPTATLSLEAQQRRELKQKMFGD